MSVGGPRVRPSDVPDGTKEGFLLSRVPGPSTEVLDYNQPSLRDEEEDGSPPRGANDPWRAFPVVPPSPDRHFNRLRPVGTPECSPAFQGWDPGRGYDRVFVPSGTSD